MMLQNTRHHISMRLIEVLLFVLSTLLVLLVWAALVSAQTQRPRAARAATTEHASAQIIAEPLFREYKGVQIGMSADEVRKKLGTPMQMSDAQDFYVFSETETAQVAYDTAKKVTAISIDYLSGNGNVPDYKTIVGTEIETRADGSIYKMIRYPKQGFWVSYNRTAGAVPLVSVTIQKIASLER